MSGTRTVGLGGARATADAGARPGAAGAVVEGGCAVSFLRTSRRDGALTERDRARPGQVRRIVRAQLRHWGLDDLVETAQLVVSELVTNAFQHGRGEEVGIRLGRAGRTVRIEVRTGSVGEPLPFPRAGGAGGSGVPGAAAVVSGASGAPESPVVSRPSAGPGPSAVNVNGGGGGDGGASGPVNGPVPVTGPVNGSGPAGGGGPFGSAVVTARPGPRPGVRPGRRPTPREVFTRTPSRPVPRTVPGAAPVLPPPVPGPLAAPDPLAEGGRGLTLVEALADGWGVQDGGAVVWCVLSSSTGDDGRG
ncbi:ATP-binding protein [Streptomyces sp. JNUCC 64]